MLNVFNQFRRIYNDDGRNDKTFFIQERRLRRSLENLKAATDKLIQASQLLHDILMERKPPTRH